MDRKRWLRPGVGLLFAAVLMLGVAACGSNEPQGFASHEVNPPTALPEFQLIAEGNRPFTLSELKGKVVVVYVGYTHCPDLCPLTMGNLGIAKKQLPKSVRDDIAVVMITADPARDTPELISRYVHFFDPSFIGVSGSTDAVLAALQDWDISPECSPPKEDGSYTVSHPATSFILNREGKLRLQMPHGLEPDVIVHDLTQVAKEGKRS